MSSLTARPHYFAPSRHLRFLKQSDGQASPKKTKHHGRKIGLLGGSFNPAHAGHRAASLLALRHFGLDEIWWLVVAQNPLKAKPDVPSVATRVAQAKKIARHPCIKIKTLPDKPCYQFTYHAVRHIMANHPRDRFAFIMGSDCWWQFHRWYRWRRLSAMLPLLIIGRAPTAQLYKKSRAGIFIRRARRFTHPLNHLASSKL
ncbi:MAG: hypothetical protein QM529_03840 [Hydrotalea sp.]|nr:hypothetical protein [Hydrotalea sp.]